MSEYVPPPPAWWDEELPLKPGLAAARPPREGESMTNPPKPIILHMADDGAPLPPYEPNMIPERIPSPNPYASLGTDLPAAAITAAALVLADVEGDDQTYRDLAYDVLTAAAPHLIAADPTTESEGFRAYKAGLAAGRVEGSAAECERLLPLLRAMHRLYDLVWNQVETLEGDADAPGYSLISDDDMDAIDEAGVAVEALLANGEFASVLNGAPHDHPLPSATTPPQEGT